MDHPPFSAALYALDLLLPAPALGQEDAFNPLHAGPAQHLAERLGLVGQIPRLTCQIWRKREEVPTAWTVDRKMLSST
jgi:hypothetical protein